jgi:tryptophan synthase alpha chain
VELSLATAMQRIVSSGSHAFIPFLTGGYPDAPTFVALLRAARSADFVEIGLPFSDPVADGPSICHASDVALKAGMNTSRLFEVLATQRDLPPLVLMTYLNPVLSFGAQQFMRAASQVGVRGIILTDLPPEDGQELFAAAAAHDIASVLLVSPTTSPARIAAIAARTSGFVYCVAVQGTTGARRQVGELAEQTVQRVRACSDRRVVVGFGIATPEHVRSTCRYSDGVVVGSALVDLVRQHHDTDTLLPRFSAAIQAFVAAAHAA